MESRQLDLRSGLAWYACGWRLFKPCPGLWLVPGICLLAVAIVFSLIPRVGGFAFTVVAPLLAAGFYHGAGEVKRGAPLRIAALCRGVTDAQARAPLLGLGVMFLGLTVAAAGLTTLIAGAGAASLVTGDGAAVAGNLTKPTPSVALAAVLLQLLIVMGMFFAVPLTAFEGVGPVRAVITSFRAAMKNILPFLLFLIIYIMLLFIASIPFFLGWIVLIPVVFCSVYCAYQGVFK